MEQSNDHHVILIIRNVSDHQLLLLQLLNRRNLIIIIIIMNENDQDMKELPKKTNEQIVFLMCLLLPYFVQQSFKLYNKKEAILHISTQQRKCSFLLFCFFLTSHLSYFIFCLTYIYT